MFQAFRVCLKKDEVAGKISVEDYRRCDLAAERLYFGLYNTDYAGPTSPISKRFVDEAQKVVNAVAGQPSLCQSDTDFRKIGAAVVKDIKGYYPDHPDVSCGTAPVQVADCPPAPYTNPFSDPKACWCNTPNVTLSPPLSCTSTSQSTQTWVPNSAWQGRPLDLPNLKIYTDYCYGRTMDGIMFLPQTTGVPTPPETLQSEPACDAKNVHIRQFVYSQCVDGYDCRSAEDRKLGTRPSYESSCGTRRYLNTWYLDECPSSEHFLTPDSSIRHPNEVHVINDEPTVNLPDREGTPPIKKTFIDVVVCGTNNQVLGAFTWMREGVKRPQTPQWCTTEGGLPKGTQGSYSDLRAVDPKSQEVSQAVCAVVNAPGFVTDPGLNAIANNFGSCY